MITMNKKLYLIFIILATTVFSGCALNNEKLPSSIEGIKLHKKMTGQGAVNLINMMHAEKVAAIDNEIGSYIGKQGSAVIYVSRFKDKSIASGEKLKMIKAILTKSTPFTVGGKLKLNGINIYRLLGIGQSHFLFSKNSYLFWVSTDNLNGEKFIKAYIKYLE